MKNLKSFLLPVSFACLLAATQVACQKEITTPAGVSSNNLKVYLTDAPIDFDNVLIDIRMVEVKVERDSCMGDGHHNSADDHGSGSDDHGNGSSNDDHGSDDHGNGNNDHHSDDNSCEVWDTLQVEAGIYDLLQFRNGVDVLIANGAIPRGEIKAVRLTLGSSNAVVVDSVTYPLALPGSNKVTLKTEHAEMISQGNFQLNLDFDLANSIVAVNGNHFELRPHIKSFNEHTSGRIEGQVLPVEAKVMVVVTGNSDTLIAMPEKDGRFKIRGIRSTQFDLHFNATAGGYRDTTITNIIINPGQEINIGRVTLHNR